MKSINAIVLVMLTATILFAQEDSDKLDDLKGDVTKITIETTDGQVELTGEEAKEMLSKMKKKSNKREQSNLNCFINNISFQIVEMSFSFVE